MKIDDLEVPLFQETSIYSGVNHRFVEKQSVANHIVGVTFPFRPHLCERFSQKDRRMATRKGHTTHIHQQWQLWSLNNSYQVGTNKPCVFGRAFVYRAWVNLKHFFSWNWVSKSIGAPPCLNLFSWLLFFKQSQEKRIWNHYSSRTPISVEPSIQGKLLFGLEPKINSWINR